MSLFSKANLLGQETYEIKFKFLDNAFRKMLNSSEVLIELNVPNSLFFRGEIFCEDVQDLSEIEFFQHDLINILYNDFLIYVKKSPNLQAIYAKLLQLEESDVLVIKYDEYKERNQIIRNLKLHDIEHDKVIRLKMNRRQSLRGEVLLADLYEAFPEHHFTLERIIELIYCDFITKVKRGEGQQAIESIVRSLTS